MAYAIGLALVSAVALLWLLIRSPQHRWPAALILFGLIAGRGLFLLDVTHSSWATALDPLLVAILLPWTMYAIALFGFHLFDPRPAARTVAIKQMQEGLVVLNAHGRVVSLNPAAASMLSIPTASARGKTLHELLPAVPDLRAGLRISGNPGATSGPQDQTPYDIEISQGTNPTSGSTHSTSPTSRTCAGSSGTC